MIKKIPAIISIIIVFALVFLVQALVINDIKIMGVVSNLVIVTIVLVSSRYNIYVCGIYSFLAGILSDVIFSLSIGKSAILYLLISCIIYSLTTVYKKDNKYVYIYFVLIATFLFELITGILSMIVLKEGLNIFSFLWINIKVIILNIALIYVVKYPCLRYLDYLDKTFKLNKV